MVEQGTFVLGACVFVCIVTAILSVVVYRQFTKDVEKLYKDNKIEREEEED